MAILRNTLISLSILLMITACGQNPKGNTQKQDSTSVVNNYTGPFDLAKLSLKENLPELMKQQGIKPEPKDSLDLTLLNYEVFKTSDPKALHFGDNDFSGNYGLHKDHVVFHYAEDKKTLVGYQLIIYDQKQTDQLIELVGEIGTLVFKRTHVTEGSIELDVNGNEVKPENSVRLTYRVWEGKSTGLNYYLTENGSGKNLSTELIVVKKTTQFGKDWISFRQLDWYLKEKSEPL
jgi:hypothetical protein